MRRAVSPLCPPLDSLIEIPCTTCSESQRPKRSRHNQLIGGNSGAQQLWQLALQLITRRMSRCVSKHLVRHAFRPSHMPNRTLNYSPTYSGWVLGIGEERRLQMKETNKYLQDALAVQIILWPQRNVSAWHMVLMKCEPPFPAAASRDGQLCGVPHPLSLSATAGPLPASRGVVGGKHQGL